MSLETAAVRCVQATGMLGSRRPGCFPWTLSLTALALINPFTIIFHNFQEQLGVVFSISQIKVSGTQAGMPRGHRLF